MLYPALLVLIAVYDARTLRAPNRIVYPSLGFAFLASFTLGWEDAREALLGGVVAFVVLLVIALVGHGRMGFGDVKAGSLCGIVVGLHGVLPMLTIAFLAGAAVASAGCAQAERRHPLHAVLRGSDAVFSGLLSSLSLVIRVWEKHRSGAISRCPARHSGGRTGR